MACFASSQLLVLAIFASLAVISGHVHGDAPRKYLGKADTIAAIREARRDVHAWHPLLGDGMSDWSPLDLPPNDLMNVVVTFIEEVDALSNDTSPTPIERLTDVLGSLVIFVRNVRMALDSTDNSRDCNLCLVLIKFLKALSLVMSWEDAAPIVSRLCIPIMVPYVGTPENAVEVCKVTGVQGPHVYYVLKQMYVLPSTHCIYADRCPSPYVENYDLEEGLPDDTDLPTLSRHTHRKKPRSTHRRMRNLEDAVKVLQMTDIHTDLTYTVGNHGDCGLPICCFEALGPGPSPAGKWAHYSCNPPQWTVDLMLRKAYELGPDFMIYSGDSPSNIVWLETFDGQMNCSRALTESIAVNMPGLPVYPGIGNHETYPANMYFMELEETRIMNQNFLEWWGPLAGFNGDNNITMLESGYFAKEVKPGLVVVSFNNIYWYEDNWYSPIANTKMPPSKNYVKVMKRWTLKVMDAARANGDKVIFMSHLPAGSPSIPWMEIRWINQLIVEYSDIVVLHPSGHHHNDNFFVIRDPVTYEPKGVSLIAPPISTDGKNPSFRMFYLDPVTYDVIDYDQYHMNLEANFDAEDPEVILVYRASEEYGLAAITGEEYDKLVTRMEHDPSVYNKFEYNHMTRRPGSNPNTCGDLECMYGALCSMSHANADHKAACNRRELPISPMVPTTTTLPPCATHTTTTTPPDETGGAASKCLNIYILIIFMAGYFITK